MTERSARRAGLATYAGIVAISAYAGALGLATGALDIGAKLNARLPFRSPVLGGLALAVIVGIPMTVVAASAWRDTPGLARAAVIAGTMMVAWITIELAFIRELSPLQFFYVGVGASFIVGGAADR